MHHLNHPNDLNYMLESKLQSQLSQFENENNKSNEERFTYSKNVGDYLDTEIERADMLRKSHNLPYRGGPHRQSGPQTSMQMHSLTQPNQLHTESKLESPDITGVLNTEEGLPGDAYAKHMA